MPSALVRDLRSLPNLITLSRIVLVLVAAVLFFTSSRVVALAIAVVAALTDYLDGIVARATGQVTRLGEILDQFSDLFFESLCLVLAISAGFLSPLVLVAYLFRELWVMTIRRFMAGERLHIASNIVGKLKTNALMWSFLPTFVSIGGLWPAAEPTLTRVGQAGIGIGLLLSFWSGASYTRQFLRGYETVAARASRSDSP